jgi:hypothetical protein
MVLWAPAIKSYALVISTSSDGGGECCAGRCYSSIYIIRNVRSCTVVDRHHNYLSL